MTPDAPLDAPSDSPSDALFDDQGPVVARGPEDLIALAPLVLGFQPHESVTLMSFGGGRPFHARIDLPDDPRDDHDVFSVLLEPARRQRVEVVALVAHTARHDRFTEAVGGLVQRLLADGVTVVDALRADGRRYWCLHCTRSEDGVPRRFAPLVSLDDGSAAALPPCPGHPYDVGAHPFTVRAVWSGRVVHRSREELAATLAPDAAARRDHALVREGARRHDCTLTTRDVGREAAWVRRTLRRHIADGSRPDDERLGRLLVDLSLGALRDAARECAERTTAREHVGLWSDAVRRSPDELLGPAAGLLAYVAWLSGDGALAWCAVDRAREAGAGHGLVDLVADLLARAVPPAPLESVVRTLDEARRRAEGETAGGGVVGDSTDGRRGRGAGVLPGRPDPSP